MIQIRPRPSLLFSALLIAVGVQAASLVTNGNMTEGDTTPKGWALVKGDRGKDLELRRDTRVFSSEPSSLYLHSNEAGGGSASQILRPKSHSVTFQGVLRAEGDFESALVAAQVFDAGWKQLGWHNLTVQGNPTDWRPFSRTITLPATTAYVNLMVMVKGTGSVWVDDLAAIPGDGADLSPEAAPPTVRQPIKRVKTEQPVVALTFDDGPNDGVMVKMLALFQQEGIRVTFFNVGRNSRKLPDIERKAHDQGHEIGNHSVNHRKMPHLDTVDEILLEITEAQEIIRNNIGEAPRVFRAPFVMHDNRMWGVLDDLQLPSIGASVGTTDWDKASTVESITDKATRKTKSGDIVLMHSWSTKTLEALPEIIRRLREQGFRFVTVSELLALEQESGT